jgi:hypothetical protein
VTKNGAPFGATGSGSVFSFTPDDNGAYLATLTVSDKDGGQATDSKTIDVTNVAPGGLGLRLSSTAISENGTVTLNGGFTDPGAGDTHTAVIDWGDGSAPTTLSLAAGVLSFGTTHQYLDDNPTATASDVATIAVTLTDKDGGQSTGSTTLTVNNLPPTIVSVTAPTDPVRLGTPVAVTVKIGDVGTKDTHTVVIDWRDGTSSTVTTSTGTASASHTYPAASVNELLIRVTDDDGGVVETKYQYVVTYDPNEGFVVGAGWIFSGQGAYLKNPNATGTAFFGFTSKYKKGASRPSGDTGFLFAAGGFLFTSTSYDWLIVQGSKAQYLGSGKINGQGDYAFQITAIDGTRTVSGKERDQFRIRIWDRLTREVVYDNRRGEDPNGDAATAIDGGRITIKD